MTDEEKPTDLLLFEVLDGLKVSRECWCYNDSHTDLCMKAQAAHERLLNKLTHMAEMQA